jgi:hypothetical protein
VVLAAGQDSMSVPWLSLSPRCCLLDSVGAWNCMLYRHVFSAWLRVSAINE